MEYLPYVYIQSEKYLYTVGHYSPGGVWLPESDHESAESAAARVHYLNGGNDEELKAERDDFLNKADKIALKHIALCEEFVAIKAERDALRAKVTQLADLIEGIADDDVDCPFCLVVGDRNHRPHCLVNVARAAAKGTES